MMHKSDIETIIKNALIKFDGMLVEHNDDTSTVFEVSIDESIDNSFIVYFKEDFRDECAEKFKITIEHVGFKPENKLMTNGRDYKFEIGDTVITTFGEIGEIDDICTCERCTERGFYEYSWVDSNGKRHYITVYDADREFYNFYRIGNYRFNKLFYKTMINNLIEEHKQEIKKLEHQLFVMESVKEGWIK